MNKKSIPNRKSKKELVLMGQAGKILEEVFTKLSPKIKPGANGQELDQSAEKLIRAHKAVPSFKGYRGYPANICLSRNEEIVHGIPSRQKVIKKGDLVSLDIGVKYQGFHADKAITLAVPPVSSRARKMTQTGQKALAEAIKILRAGIRIGTVSALIQEIIEKDNFTVIRDLTGHSIGRALQEEPAIPNYGKPESGFVLEPGMVLALEPMVGESSPEIKKLSDGWTIITTDGGLSAHFEETIAILEDGFCILTNHRLNKRLGGKKI